MVISSDIQEKFIQWAKTTLGSEIVVLKEPHGYEGVVYELKTNTENYFLKMGSGFARERARLGWFQDKVPVPKVVDFLIEGDKEAMILTAVKGKNLKVYSQEWSVEKMTDKLADVLHQFHSVSTIGWPFDAPDAGKVLVHGDACLPNFIFSEDSFSGYIDVGDSRISSPEADLAATIWSLQFNMGKGHGVMLLQKYGWDKATDEEAERLRQEYIRYQGTRGFSLGHLGPQ
ncbi:MAG: Aminoglycoside phosphotransferase [Parcubacteria bacterium C7867-005]|nr:MAG: Aminoglycoside phosphotransferase [Parcubacteria bacterium C7867-005]